MTLFSNGDVRFSCLPKTEATLWKIELINSSKDRLVVAITLAKGDTLSEANGKCKIEPKVNS